MTTNAVPVLLRHAERVPLGIQHGLLRERVERELERDLVDEHPAIAMTGFEVLELTLDDRVVVRDQMVDVSGQRFI